MRLIAVAMSVLLLCASLALVEVRSSEKKSYSDFVELRVYTVKDGERDRFLARSSL